MLKFLPLFLICLAGISVPGETKNYLNCDTDMELDAESVSCGAHSNQPAQLDHTTGYQSGSSSKMSQGATPCPAPVPLPPGWYTYSCMMKGTPGAKAVFTVIDTETSWPEILRNRQTKTVEPTSEWKRYELTFEANGRSSYFPYAGSVNDGTVWLDRAMLNAGKKAAPWRPGSGYTCKLELGMVPGNVQKFDLPVKLNFRVLSYQGAHSAPRMEIHLSDYREKQLKIFTVPLNFDRDGHAEGALEIPTDKRSGWFRLDARIGKLPVATAAFVLTRPVEEYPSPAPFVGLCGGQNLPEAGRLIGVGWVDGALTQWAYQKRSRGNPDYTGSVYDFSDHIRRLKALRKAGYRIKQLFWLYPPAGLQAENVVAGARRFGVGLHAFLPPPEVIDNQMREYFRQMAEACKGLIDIYELSGEMDALIGVNSYYRHLDGGKFDLGPFTVGAGMELLARLVNVAADEIRKVDPDVLISGIRPCDLDCRQKFIFSQELFKRVGNQLNAFGVDCYAYPRIIAPRRVPCGNEQELPDTFRAARMAMAAHCRASDYVYVSEYGFAVDPAVSDRYPYQHQYINRMIRAFLMAKVSGFRHLDWYSLKAADEGGHNYSLWKKESFPLPGVAALNTVAGIVEGVKRHENIKLRSHIGMTLFEKMDGQAVAALWSVEDGARPVIGFTAKDLLFSDEMGNPVHPEIRDGNVRIELNEMPIFVRRAKTSGENFTILGNILKNARVLNETPVFAALRPESRTVLKIHLNNLSGTDGVSGTVELKYEKTGMLRNEKFRLSPGEKKILRVPTPETGEKLTAWLRFEAGGEPLKLDYTAEVPIKVPCRPGVKIDGDMKSWQEIRPFHLSGVGNIYPGDHAPYSGPEDLSAELYWAHNNRDFFFAAVVRDDLHRNVHAGYESWRGDALQVGIDPENNRLQNKKTLSPDQDDLFLTLALTLQGKTLSVAHEPVSGQTRRRAEFVVRRDEKHKKTIYQIRIPLEVLGQHLKRGSVFGFSCAVLDDDVGRKAEYWLYLTDGLLGGYNPAIWKKCILE